LPGEKWKVVEGTNTHYLVSNKGRLKNFYLNHKEEIIDPSQIFPMLNVTMYHLMAKYFANVELKYVYRKDGNRLNYNIDNLLFNEIENLPGEEWKKINTIWVNDEDKNTLNILSEYEISTHGRIRYIRNFRMYISKGMIENGQYIFRTTVNQNVFRRIIMMNYGGKCALTGIDIPELLVASHIKPWAKCKEERLNPDNGICLSSLYDDSFDKGLIGFDNNYRVVLSKRLTNNFDKSYYDKYFGSLNHQQLILPEEHKPNLQFLEWHMDEVFQR
jgi:putative restriction endonuclease